MKIWDRSTPRGRPVDEAARQLLSSAITKSYEAWPDEFGPSVTQIEEERKRLAAMAAVAPEPENEPERLMSLGAWIALSWLIEYADTTRPPHNSIALKALVAQSQPGGRPA